MSNFTSGSNAKSGPISLGSATEPSDSDAGWVHHNTRVLVDNTPDYLMLLDLQGVVLLVNRPFPDLSMEDMTGQKLSTLLPIRFRQDLTDSLQRVTERKIPERCEVEYRSQSGQIWSLEVRAGV